jgi:predicted nucleic acid-binding protein
LKKEKKEQTKLSADSVRARVIFQKSMINTLLCPNSAISALLAAGRRKLSLVDCTSFEIMRSLGIKTVFAFDSHFVEQGFKIIT